MAEKKKASNGFVLSISHEGRPIVKRHFTTDQYNNDVRHSVDLNDFMEYLVDEIKEFFKREDLNYMYEKYDLRDERFLPKPRKVKKEGQDATKSSK